MSAKLLTKALYEKLLKQGQQQQDARTRGDWIDFPPVVKFFTPDAGASWLLCELYPDDPDVAFGLCDLGLGFPEVGDVRLSELAALRGRFGLPVERDCSFRPDRPLSAYAKVAYAARRILA
jgi:hypothetical protein